MISEACDQKHTKSWIINVRRSSDSPPDLLQTAQHTSHCCLCLTKVLPIFNEVRKDLKPIVRGRGNGEEKQEARVMTEVINPSQTWSHRWWTWAQSMHWAERWCTHSLLFAVLLEQGDSKHLMDILCNQDTNVHLCAVSFYLFFFFCRKVISF